MDTIMRAADIQDRDGTVLLMAKWFGLYPVLLKLYADAGYQAPKFQQGRTGVCRKVNLEIVRRHDTGKFGGLPKCWIVERKIAWLNRCRRLSNDEGYLSRNALAILRWYESIRGWGIRFG
jgi:transposase